VGLDQRPSGRIGREFSRQMKIEISKKSDVRESRKLPVTAIPGFLFSDL
jgi:hypothetical protein